MALLFFLAFLQVSWALQSRSTSATLDSIASNKTSTPKMLTLNYPAKCVIPDFPVPSLQERSDRNVCKHSFSFVGEANFYEDRQTIDMIKQYRTKSVLVKGGTTHIVISSLTFSAAMILIGLIMYKAYEAVKMNQRQRLYRAMDAMMIIWCGVFGISMAVILLAIYRGQGLNAVVEGYNYLEFIRTNKGKFKYDPELFIPAVVVAAVMVVAIAVTLTLKKMRENRYLSVVEKDPNTVTTDSTSGGRRYELDYMKYYQILGIVCLAHFWQYGETGRAGMDISPMFCGMDVFAWTHWLIGFVIISGYNAPVRYSDLISRRTKRIFKVLFMYLWCQFLYLMYYYYVFTPIVLARHKGSRATAEDIIQGNNDFAIDHDHNNQSYLELTLNGTSFFLHWLGKPAYVLWYLRSLFAWLLVIPMWLQLAYPITLSFFVGLVGMYFQPNVSIVPLDYGLTLEMFPYFVIGASVKYYGWDKWLFDFAKDRLTQYASAAMILITFSFAFVCPFYVNGEWHIFYPSFGAMKDKAYDGQWWYSIGVGSLMLTNCAMVFSCFSVAPTFPSYFTKAASFSLVPYMLHYMVVLLLVAFGFYGEGFSYRFDDGKWWATNFIGFGTAMVLMHPPIGSKFMYVINPPFIDWLFPGSKKSDSLKDGLGKGKYLSKKTINSSSRIEREGLLDAKHKN